MTETAREVIAFATRAPSIHNTQPWRWRIRGSQLDLLADRGRQLLIADPEARHLTISCGSALHHAVVRARSLGHTCEVELLPTAGDPDHLATLRLGPGRPNPAAEQETDVLTRRRTDRRRFTAWPLADDRLDEMTAEVSEPGAGAVPIRETVRRVRVGLLVSKAMWAESNDPRYVAEQSRWTAPSDDGGVPETHRPPPHPRLGVVSRFDDPAAEAMDRDAVQGTDGLVVIATEQDRPEDWIRSGVLLCRIWGRAMAAGLSLVPLSQVIEVPDTRVALAQEMPPGSGHPQLLLRLGWQEIARNPLPPTSRRPVDDVLLP